MGNRQGAPPPARPPTSTAPDVVMQDPQNAPNQPRRPAVRQANVQLRQPARRFEASKPSQVDEFFQLSGNNQLVLQFFKLDIGLIRRLSHPSITNLYLRGVSCTDEALELIPRVFQKEVSVQKLRLSNTYRVANSPVFKLMSLPFYTPTLREICIYHIDFDDTMWPKLAWNLRHNRTLEILTGECNFQENEARQRNCVVMAEVYHLKEFSLPVFYLGRVAVWSLGNGIQKGIEDGDTKLESICCSQNNGISFLPAWKYYLGSLQKSETMKTVHHGWFDEKTYDPEAVAYWKTSIGLHFSR